MPHGDLSLPSSPRALCFGVLLRYFNMMSIDVSNTLGAAYIGAVFTFM